MKKTTIGAFIKAPRAKRAFVPLETGLPFVGELLWPTRRHAELNRLVCYTIATDCMAPYFPVGTSVALQRVRRATDIVEGVYLWQAVTPDYCRVVLGRLESQRRGAITLRRETDLDEAVLPYCPLLWSRPGFALFRVSHYVSLPTGKVTEELLTPVATNDITDARVEEKLFEGQWQITLRHAFADPFSGIITPWAANLIGRILQTDSQRTLAAIEAQLDAIRGRLLVAQARQLVKKGGASL